MLDFAKSGARIRQIWCSNSANLVLEFVKSGARIRQITPPWPLTVVDKQDKHSPSYIICKAHTHIHTLQKGTGYGAGDGWSEVWFWSWWDLNFSIWVNPSNSLTKMSQNQEPFPAIRWCSFSWTHLIKIPCWTVTGTQPHLRYTPDRSSSHLQPLGSHLQPVVWAATCSHLQVAAVAAKWKLKMRTSCKLKSNYCESGFTIDIQ